MKQSRIFQIPLKYQFLICLATIGVIGIVCFFWSHLIGYKVVALILMMAVSIAAILFEIFPVLLTAILSALIWNFFFIPPVFSFHIDNAEDTLLFLMYFIIALVNGVLTNRIRKAENKARDKDDKEQTIKLYNTLLNSLSHELRTPISTIIGAVDTLKENRETLSLANQVELLSEIDIASIRLNRQVENLLNMSRLESGMLKPKPDWCDLNELVFSCIQKFPENEQKQIHFLFDEKLPLYHIDSGLFEQVLQNLIHNALLYSPDNSQVSVQLRVIDNGFELIIADNGHGFPENEMENVFNKFYRLSGNHSGGSGLGLSIVRGFVDAMKGSVTLRNRVEGGAEFSIHIPAASNYLANFKHE